MKDVFLLPCTCGKKVSVDIGQAGTSVTCDCGKQLTVPRFRAMQDLERAQPAPDAVDDKASEWNALRGVAFSLGMLISLIAGVVVSYHLYAYWVVSDGGEAWKKEHIQEMRDAVDYLAPAEALADFQDMATKGLSVDGVPPWAQVSAVRQVSLQWLFVGLVALAVGLVSLSASLIGTRRPRAK